MTTSPFSQHVRPLLSASIFAALLAYSPLGLAQPAEPPGPKAPTDAAPPGPTGAGAPTGTPPGDESAKVGAPVVPAAPVVDHLPTTVAPESVVAKTAAEKTKGAGGSFMDTRLTWTFGDDDVLHRTGATQPLSPLPNIGDRPGYRLFFDNLNSRFTGRENVSHLVMYRKMPGFIPNLDTEAALVLRFDMQELAANNQNVNRALNDAGSYLRIFYKTGEDVKAKKAYGVGLVFFPLDTDRFRLGYLYDISWGGTNATRNESIFPRLVGSSPGLKVQYDGPGFYFFGGFKTAQIVQPQTNLRPGATSGNEVEVVRVAETNYGFLGGAGADLGSALHADVGGGYFQQGRFEFPDMRPPPDTDRQAPRVFTYGGSGRLVFHKDMPTPQSIDFLLYRNDPNAPMQLFRPEVYKPGELAYSVAVEFTRLHQNLHDPDPGKSGASKIQPAHAAAIQGVIKIDYARIGLAAIYRDLPFVLRNVPSFVPFEALDTTTTKTQNEIFFAGSLDYYFEKLKLRPGIGGGVQLPATFSAESNVGNASADRTVVVRSQGNVSILPLGAKRKPIYQTRASLRWDLSDIFAAIGWVQMVHDPDATIVTRDPTEGTIGIRTFQSSTFFGFGMTLQARY
ncbi:MAG: hypothetical protein HYV09_13905 [Deltaproteobacteria bacterium]|nr:hypothetical protein [Deltaproteobacteria bacterium]